MKKYFIIYSILLVFLVIPNHISLGGGRQENTNSNDNRTFLEKIEEKFEEARKTHEMAYSQNYILKDMTEFLIDGEYGNQNLYVHVPKQEVKKIEVDKKYFPNSMYFSLESFKNPQYIVIDSIMEGDGCAHIENWMDIETYSIVQSVEKCENKIEIEDKKYEVTYNFINKNKVVSGWGLGVKTLKITQDMMKKYENKEFIARWRNIKMANIILPISKLIEFYHPYLDETGMSTRYDFPNKVFDLDLIDYKQGYLTINTNKNKERKWTPLYKFLIDFSQSPIRIQQIPVTFNI